jgi:nitrous oxidase accessory protein NosD
VAPTDVNSAFPLAFGIGVEDEAIADIQRNTVQSNNLVVPTVILSPSLWTGIHLRDAHGDSRVRGNIVSGAFTGVMVDNGTITVNPTAATAGPEIAGNRASNSFAGFEIDQDATDIHHNRSVNNQYGITVLSSDNNLHDNDFRGNYGIDCGDTTTGGGTAGTANNWNDNLGNTSSPAGLCTADPV